MGQGAGTGLGEWGKYGAGGGRYGTGGRYRVGGMG